LVGATEIESGDTGSLSVRSALELLSAAYSLHPGFGEAHIHEARIGLRPALRDNTPRLVCEPGLVSINGMYRHGFLTGPALVEQATMRMELAA
jgi:glycine oxidase